MTGIVYFLLFLCVAGNETAKTGKIVQSSHVTRPCHGINIVESLGIQQTLEKSPSVKALKIATRLPKVDFYASNLISYFNVTYESTLMCNFRDHLTLKINIVCSLSKNMTITKDELQLEKWMGCDHKIELESAAACCIIAANYTKSTISECKRKDNLESSTAYGIKECTNGENDQFAISLLWFLIVLFCIYVAIVVYVLIWKRECTRPSVQPLKIELKNLESSNKKILLMGRSGSGKTCIRKNIFKNSIQEIDQSFTNIGVGCSHICFLGNLVLNLWDCNGREDLMKIYYASQRDNIFRNVEVLIYVFDVESRELDKDMHYYQSCLEAILQNSPDAKVFCLIHKMDLVQEDQRDSIFREREQVLRRLSLPLQCTCFRTSIWDETLYRAWSPITHMLIPNVNRLEQSLTQFANIIDADEVLLFERATFLTIIHHHRRYNTDIQRFDKISNIIKQFKQNCSKLRSKAISMEINDSKFFVIIGVFQPNAGVMIVVSDPNSLAATGIKCHNARKHFIKLK